MAFQMALIEALAASPDAPSLESKGRPNGRHDWAEVPIAPSSPVEREPERTTPRTIPIEPPQRSTARRA
ncbi:MAG: hypothetical protein U0794_07425 [Isosphaeraceae bacterium]